MADESTFTFNTGYRLSLTAQSGLRSATNSLSQSLERLSSGLRINSAKDDPAGVSLAATTRTDSRVYAQAVKNVNDAISLSNMAYEGLQSLVEVAARQKELATEAENSTLSLSQRQALQEESNKLVDEYNRIIQSTDWNDLKPYDASLDDLKIQAGYGSNAAIALAFGQDLERLVGSGAFSATGTFGTAVSMRGTTLADLNEDGILDYIATDFDTTGQLFVYLGNGDGSFQAETTYSTGDRPAGISAADLNGDGHIDIAAANFSSNSITIHFGAGDGTFAAATTISSVSNTSDVIAKDIDNDGDLDLVATTYAASGYIQVMLNDGSGSFSSPVSYESGLRTYRLDLADLNNDGNLDVIAADHDATGNTAILLGNGDGTFASIQTLSFDSSIEALAADFNLDGNMDLLMAHYYDNTVEVALGNGDGTFASSYLLSTPEPRSIRTEDINGDGNADITFATNELNIVVATGRGDGTFDAPVCTSTSILSYFNIGDLNNDGVSDIVGASSNYSNSAVFLGVGRNTTTMSYLNLYSVEDAEASAEIADAAYTRTSTELGRVQAQQNRLSVAVGNLQSAQLGYDAAYHRIVDADVAEEVANMVKAQIVGDSATAMLAQANQETAMVVKLLGSLSANKDSK